MKKFLDYNGLAQVIAWIQGELETIRNNTAQTRSGTIATNVVLNPEQTSNLDSVNDAYTEATASTDLENTQTSDSSTEENLTK